jgi:ParB family transcriptional regulator, chromosome partitioning protein
LKRKALGKGLSALLPEPETSTPPAAAGALANLELAIDQLEPNPDQPRQTIDSVRLQELAASIRATGVVQPILVRPRGARYQIVAGERRWRAAQLAGLEQVPVTVRDIPDDRLLEVALVENIQRQDLSPIEEAQAYSRLVETLGLSQEDLAQRVGRERSTVANALRLLRLPREIQELVATVRLDAGHARAILALDTAEAQIALAREAARKGLSVREVERRVAQARAPEPSAARRRDANTAAAEERLRAVLGTRVRIARRGKGGQLQIQFGSEAELNRLYESLLRVARGAR